MHGENISVANCSLTYEFLFRRYRAEDITVKTDIHSTINYITAITPPSNTNLCAGAMNYSDTTSHLPRYLSLAMLPRSIKLIGTSSVRK